MSARVLLATGNDILATGLTARLSTETGIDSVTVVRDGLEALRALEASPLDVVVLDVMLPGIPGLGLIERARQRRQSLAWVALAQRPARSEIEEIMRAGAAGIVSTCSSAAALAEAVRRVHAGGAYVATEVMNTLVEAPLNGDMTQSQASTALTAREREVLRLIADGLSCPEIAQRLGVSPRTVETHRAHMMSKLDLRKTAALVRYAVREGLVAA